MVAFPSLIRCPSQSGRLGDGRKEGVRSRERTDAG